jgi:hypothetical protein
MHPVHRLTLELELQWGVGASQNLRRGRSIVVRSRGQKPIESAWELRIERNDGVIDLVKANMKTSWRSVLTAPEKFDR